MKYKRLNTDELRKLEKEFIDFLVVNGITAEEWERLKEDKPDVADSIIDHFSDVVWEGALRKCNYLERISENSIYSFHCKENEIELIRIYTDSEIDMNSIPFSALFNDPSISWKIQKATKPYLQKREIELFQMIENGAHISDGKLNDKLKTL